MKNLLKTGIFWIVIVLTARRSRQEKREGGEKLLKKASMSQVKVPLEKSKIQSSKTTLPELNPCQLPINEKKDNFKMDMPILKNLQAGLPFPHQTAVMNWFGRGFFQRK